MRTLVLFLALPLLLAARLGTAQGQTVMPCAVFAASYGIDSNMVNDSTRLSLWLRAQPDTGYSNLSTQCALLNTKVQHMLSSLRNTYPIRNDTLWMDSATCIVDHMAYSAKLSHLSQQLLRLSAHYDQKEQQRMVAFFKAAEAEARAKAAAEQQHRNDSLSVMMHVIDSLHRHISLLCDGDNLTDKSQAKHRKDIYYCYLSLYNKYNLSSPQANTRQLQQLAALAAVQRDIADSLLGSHSYDARMAQFADKLKQRCANGHKEISKSYVRTFREVSVPVQFSTIAEYQHFTKQLKDILAVQQGYLRVADLCDTIDAGSAAIMQRAARRKAVQTSYKSALGVVDMLPAFTTVDESTRFIAKIQTFISVQRLYLSVMDHMDSIDLRGNEVLAQCGQEYPDLASAYKELVAVYDFSPVFTTPEGAAFFDNTLNDFETLQDTYIRLLNLRQLITLKEKHILDNASLPRCVKAGYKLIKSATPMKPDFTTVARGELFINSMKDFITIQDTVSAIAERQHHIEANIKQLKAWNKANGSTVHAYTVLRNEMTIDFTITNTTDLQAYGKYQERQLKLQQRFINVILSDERADYNKRLKGVRDADKIRLIMNL